AAPASYRRKTATLPANAYGPVPAGEAARGSGSARRVCASILLDLLLVGAIGTTLYVLTMRPADDVATKTPSVAVTAPEPPPSSAPPVRVRTPEPAPRPVAPPPARARKNAPPAPERYDALRKAWGG